MRTHLVQIANAVQKNKIMSKLKGTNQVYDGYFKMLEATIVEINGVEYQRT